MIRVVLDTNIIVSALLQPLGPSAQVFLFALGGSIDCASAAISMPSMKRSSVVHDCNALMTS
jgi:predicted nucleic acid-binding protein